MILWDVNLWVYAFRADSPYHPKAYKEITKDLEGSEPVVFSPAVAASFLRLVTNVKIYIEPSGTREAWQFIDYTRDHPLSVFHNFDDMAFGIFKHICLTGGDAGNAVPDALLAALAVRHDCVFTTFDTGFRRYSGLNLRLLHPPGGSG